jgi:hypothetical protein
MRIAPPFHFRLFLIVSIELLNAKALRRLLALAQPDRSVNS